MKFLVCFCLSLALVSAAADNRAVAARLAKLARKAQNSGRTVRAYMLFSEAAARDPQNVSYRANRDALAPVARLLTKANVENADITSDVFSAENEAAHPEPPIERISPAEWQGASLQPVPHVRFDPATHDFNLRADAKSLLVQVATAYGVHALTDVDIQAGKPIHFELNGASFRTALEALTAATGTFVFPVSTSVIYFAPNTEAKRNELEPVVIVTFPLPEALSEKDLIETANAVRGLLNLRTIGWDSLNRMVVIRDRATRAEIARSLMEALLLPRAQVSFEVQFLATDTDKNYHYGVTLQTLYQFMYFGSIGGFQSVLPAAINSTQFLPFGGGATIFGIGVADAMAFATYSKTVSQAIFDATVVVADGGTANFHIGDKYPIPTSLYTGFGQGQDSIYNPAPQITLEDLGLILKLTPHVNGEGNIDINLEANYKTLGTQTFNTVPSVAERSFKGTVSLRQGQWAILAGIDSTASSISRSGLIGLGSIPWLNQLLTENTRDTQTSNLLLVIKPTITRLPMSDVISPQFLLGTRHGQRVLI